VGKETAKPNSTIVHSTGIYYFAALTKMEKL